MAPVKGPFLVTSSFLSSASSSCGDACDGDDACDDERACGDAYDDASSAWPLLRLRLTALQTR